MLTHTNMIANSASICSILVEWTPGDRHICYLPLAHIYERINLVSCIFTGTSIGFYSGNVQVSNPSRVGSLRLVVSQGACGATHYYSTGCASYEKLPLWRNPLHYSIGCASYEKLPSIRFYNAGIVKPLSLGRTARVLEETKCDELALC